MKLIRDIPPEFPSLRDRVDALATRSKELVRRISGPARERLLPAERDAAAREFLAVEEELAPLRANFTAMVASWVEVL
jgi:hypothetical protein